MAGVTKRPVKSPDGNPRAELSAALKAAKAAHGAVNKQKQAVQKLFSEMLAAQNQLPVLEKAVAKAERAHIDAVAESAVAGSPAPASTVAEAQAAVVFARDRVNSLRSARQTVEAEISEYETDAVAADTEVEACISRIIADHVEILIKEASELARRLAPYKAALLAFVRDHSNSPTEWHLLDGFRKSREPLDDLADRALLVLNGPATAPSVCWKEIRASLRENPNAAVLRPLVTAFDGLLIKDDEPRPTAS
jgi:hypothetical protein